MRQKEFSVPVQKVYEYITRKVIKTINRLLNYATTKWKMSD